VFTRTEDFIYNLLKSFQIEDPFQLTLENISALIMLPVRYWEFTSEASYRNGVYVLFLDENLTKQEQWQDFAHELCHILFHAGNQLHMPVMFRELQEWQATSFAFHFCIPAYLLDKINLPNNKREAIKVIADNFGVEYEFAEERLEKWLQQREGYLFHEKLIKEVSG